MVFTQRARTSLAANTESLRYLGVGNHAAADSGQYGRPFLAQMDARNANDPGAGKSLT
jgi:hypothetical protein